MKAKQTLASVVLNLLPLIIVLASVVALILAIVLPVLILGRGSGRIVVFTLIAVGGMIVAMIWAIVDARKMINNIQPTQGLELYPQYHPGLWNEINGMAQAMQTAPPQRIVLTPEVNAAVTEIRGVREMLIGIPLLAGFTVSQLRSVLAHELGHYAGGDTARLAKTQRKLLEAQFMATSGSRFEWMFVLYYKLCRAATAAASREQEHVADSFSLRYAGLEGSQSALVRLEELVYASSLVEERFLSLIGHAQARGSMVDAYWRVLAASSEDIKAQASAALAHEQPGKFSSHPVTRERLQALAAAHTAAGSPAAPTQDERPAVELIGGGNQWLAQAEEAFFKTPLPLRSWDDIRAGTATAEGGDYASGLMRRLADAGMPVNDDTSIDEVISQLTNPEHHIPAEQQVGVLIALILAVTQAQGRAQREHDAHNNAFLALPSGHQLRPQEHLVVNEQPVADLAGTTRQLLTSMGVDLTQPTGAKLHLDAERFVGAATLVVSEGTRQLDMVATTSGFILVPSGVGLAVTMVGGQSKRHQSDRLEQLLSHSFDEIRALPEAKWFPVEEIEAISVNPGINAISDQLVMFLRLKDGRKVSIKQIQQGVWTNKVQDNLKAAFAHKLGKV